MPDSHKKTTQGTEEDGRCPLCGGLVIEVNEKKHPDFFFSCLKCKAEWSEGKTPWEKVA